MIAPGNETELAETVAAATGPVRIRGGGTRDVGRPLNAEVLNTAGLSGVSLYEPGALTLVAGAGTPLAEIERVLAAEGQRLAFEPGDMRGLLGTMGDSTIGGVIASNASGPRRVQAGAARDFLLGVRFVDGAGRIIKNGGRVMKNVTGYDLVKLLAGSWGTLGVLSEVSLKVLPVPETSAVLLIEGLAVPEAVRAMAAALGSPYEVTGAAHTPVGLDGAPMTMIRIEGFEASVAYRAEKLRELLAPFGTADVETGPERTAAGWRWIRDVEAFHAVPGDVWRFSVKPSDAVALTDALGAERVVLDWGGGLVWALCEPGTDLRARMGSVKGHATLIRASAETRGTIAPFQPEPAPIARLTEGLRANFDPRGILNPGLMG